jgi:hypothetical protein
LGIFYSLNERVSAKDTVLGYNRLSQVERAFRTLKSLDLEVRPIRHRRERRVRAHIFLCMLAFYVEWHMIEAWRPLLFADEDPAAKAIRDPVAPVPRSAAVLHKVHTHTLDDGPHVHSFRTLLTHLSGIVRNLRRLPEAPLDTPPFQIVTTPTTNQQRALDLLETVRV